MKIEALLLRIAELQEVLPEVRWCDSDRLVLENAPEVSPGGYLNEYGFWVIATTIGGNAIVVSETESAIHFADHTSYCDDEVSFEDHEGTGEWIDLPISAEAVRRSLFTLAESPADFLSKARSGELSNILDEID